LRLDYWKVYRHHNRIVQEKLVWHLPGRVWAIDHAKPPTPVDGIYPAMFAVRDLASGLKNRTRHHAASEDHPGFWTSEDTEAARRHANELPKEYNQPTALELWQARTPIDHAERERFLLTVERFRCQMEATMNPEHQTAADKAAIHRRDVCQALAELGIVSTE
jgi:hypothetical protein